MPGFRPCTADLVRLAKYEERRKVEQTNRTAIREGRKVYDANFQ